MSYLCWSVRKKGEQAEMVHMCHKTRFLIFPFILPVFMRASSSPCTIGQTVPTVVSTWNERQPAMSCSYSEDAHHTESRVNHRSSNHVTVDDFCMCSASTVFRFCDAARPQMCTEFLHFSLSLWILCCDFFYESAPSVRPSMCTVLQNVTSKQWTMKIDGSEGCDNQISFVVGQSLVLELCSLGMIIPSIVIIEVYTSVVWFVIFCVKMIADVINTQQVPDTSAWEWDEHRASNIGGCTTTAVLAFVWPSVDLEVYIPIRQLWNRHSATLVLVSGLPYRQWLRLFQEMFERSQQMLFRKWILTFD